MTADGFARALTALLAVSSVLPILPVVYEVTAEMPPEEGRRYRLLALFQANLVALAFLLGAPALLAALQLDLHDLRVAGGIVLLVYAIHDLLFSRAARNRRLVRGPPASPIAPLGVPILVGPATLSMVLVLGQAHGVAAVATAMAITAALNALCLIVGERVLEALGEGGRSALGKVASLVIATLGASMLRLGVLGALGA